MLPQRLHIAMHGVLIRGRATGAETIGGVSLTSARPPACRWQVLPQHAGAATTGIDTHLPAQCSHCRLHECRTGSELRNLRLPYHRDRLS